jgi:hypothetical protein
MSRGAAKESSAARRLRNESSSVLGLAKHVNARKRPFPSGLFALTIILHDADAIVTRLS